MPNKDTITIKENKDDDVTCEGTVQLIEWTFNGKEISTNKKDEYVASIGTYLVNSH